MEEFTLEKCLYCKLYTALKNGVCFNCESKAKLPDFFKDLFKTEEQ